MNITIMILLETYRRPDALRVRKAVPDKMQFFRAVRPKKGFKLLEQSLRPRETPRETCRGEFKVTTKKSSAIV
jgi:hypothetical protein